MSLRLKWCRATGIDRANIDRLLAGFLRDEYIDGRRWGFANVVLKGGSVEADYVERIEVVSKVNDPFGNVLEFPLVRFDQFSFIIRAKFPHIELQDAPRSLGTFLNQIAAYLDFKIALESITVDLPKWISAIEQNVDSISVNGALVSNLTLSNSVQAKIAFFGTAEVRPFVRKLTVKYVYSFSRMQVNGLFRSHRFKCDLFSDGRATILSGVETEVAKILRSTLKDVVEEK
ncbi:MAG TPA: hypothetical protein VMQ67_03870 [Candidatus Saccharimonadales bacterium]|jgi:hypothetical protein|nr:hypothetical protein [Candidatus Saccharimonadales bacterium]